MVHYQEIKNTKTFCINQKVTLGADLGAYLNVTALLETCIFLGLIFIRNGKAFV